MDAQLERSMYNNTPESIISSRASLPTPTSERALEDYDHIFATPPKSFQEQEVTASPPNFSNIVLVTNHNSNINLNVLFNILPIVKISPKEIEKNGFKFDQIFISVRHYPKFRGYRGPSNIKSFLDLDFYYKNNSFHLKISKEKITIVGGKSSKFSKEMIEVIYRHFERMNEKWIEYKGMSDDDKNKIMTMFEENKPPPQDDKYFSFYDHLESIIDRDEDDVDDRLRDIFPVIGVPLFDKPPVFTNLVNCNLVYNYRLPSTSIILKEKANKLKELGYEVSYDNLVFVKQFIAKWHDSTHNDNFTFTIQTIGSIKQNTSSTHERSLEMYEKLITDLGFKPYKEGQPYAVKTTVKKNVQVQVSLEAEKIIDRYLKV